MKIPDSIREKCISLCLDGMTTKQASSILNISNGSVGNIKKESGLSFRKVGEHKRIHFFNDDFFKSIDNFEKAYWLGFIFADGCINKTQTSLSISLARKDRSVLEYFLKSLEAPESCIYDTLSKVGLKHHEVSRISLNSKKMVSHLMRLGVIPKKSLILEAPIIKSKFIWDFILGYFDGDGHVSKTSNTISIACSIPFGIWLNQILTKNKIKNKIRHLNKICYVEIYGLLNLIKFRDKIYQNPNPCLSRKKEIFFSKKTETPKQKQEREMKLISSLFKSKISYSDASKKTGLSINRIHHLIKCNNRK